MFLVKDYLEVAEDYILGHCTFTNYLKLSFDGSSICIQYKGHLSPEAPVISAKICNEKAFGDFIPVTPKELKIYLAEDPGRNHINIGFFLEPKI